MLGGIGAIEKHSKRTIAKIGNTAANVSVNFSLSLECVNLNALYRLSSRYLYLLVLAMNGCLLIFVHEIRA